MEIVTSILEVSDVQHYKEPAAPGLRLSHESAGLQLELPVMQESRLRFFADVGVGATRLRSYEFNVLPSQRYRLSETFISLLGGLTARYAVTDDFRAFIGIRRFLYLNDADNLVIDETPDPGRLLDTSSWTFPITFGFQLGFK